MGVPYPSIRVRASMVSTPLSERPSGCIVDFQLARARSGRAGLKRHGLTFPVALKRREFVRLPSSHPPGSSQANLPEDEIEKPTGNRPERKRQRAQPYQPLGKLHQPESRVHAYQVISGFDPYLFQGFANHGTALCSIRQQDVHA